MSNTIARWESRGAAHFVELIDNHSYYSYRANDAGGTLAARNIVDAIVELEVKVKSGYFLPDSAKTPMIRKF